MGRDEVALRCQSMRSMLIAETKWCWFGRGGCAGPMKCMKCA